ncbi:WD40 repeat domain-containing protein [Motiliproteus sp. SC1-56]|uniref:WD40 repeat domain-containing protein n=1 Tax=Motiliproteus sp. SC1-56 TaxID=2799565 RepID=UPI001A8F1DD5|nr:hypothetical protein [Motiliproteus sp. SC1-56]
MRPGAAALAAFLSLGLGGCGVDSPDAQVEFAVQGAYSGTISPQSRYAFIGSIQHGGSLWDVQQRERLYNWNHQEGAYSNLVAADFSPDGDYAVTAGQRDLVLWEVSSGLAQGFWNAPGGIQDVALAADGSFALLGLDDHTAVYFDIKNGGVRQTFFHEGPVRAVDLSDDGQLALTGGDDNLARLWDLSRGAELLSVGHGNGVNTVALAPNGRYAFSAGQLDKAVIWDTSSGEILQTLSGPATFASQRLTYTAARFSPASDRLLTGSSAGLIQLWDIRSGEELRRWKAHLRDPFRPTGATIYGLGFGDNGRFYALASNGYLNILR